MKRKWDDEIQRWANNSDAVVQKRYLFDPEQSWITCTAPRWNDTECEYRVSLAKIEGKPVFIGDELYHNGVKTIANECYSFIDIEDWSWNPPKSKTITVTIPFPISVVGIAKNWNVVSIDFENERDKDEAMFQFEKEMTK